MNTLYMYKKCDWTASYCKSAETRLKFARNFRKSDDQRVLFKDINRQYR